MNRNTILIAAWIALLAGTSPAAEDAINMEPLIAIAHLDKAQKISHLAALAIVDYQQTMSIIRRPDPFIEMNPLLGEHPNRTEVAAFGILGVAATAMIADIEHPLAGILVNSIIATEQVNVWENQYAMERRTTLPIMIVATFPF